MSGKVIMLFLVLLSGRILCAALIDKCLLVLYWYFLVTDNSDQLISFSELVSLRIQNSDLVCKLTGLEFGTSIFTSVLDPL